MIYVHIICLKVLVCFFLKNYVLFMNEKVDNRQLLSTNEKNISTTAIWQYVKKIRSLGDRNGISW
jgi:hypothetical protein